MLSKAARPSSTAWTMWAKLSSKRTMSAAERATSVPTTPMATPRSAWRRGGGGWGCVDAAAGHAHTLAEGLERLGDAELLLGGDAGQLRHAAAEQVGEGV